jgi:hypothetical protein
MSQDFSNLLDERMKEIAREVAQEVMRHYVADTQAENQASAHLRQQLTLIKAKEHVTVKEAALLLSCSESHIRKLVILTRKGKAHRPIPFVDIEGVTVFRLSALMDWANASRQLQVIKNEAA